MAAESLYPLRFRTILKRALWGGRRLATVLGKQLGPEPDYAEAWELCDLESAQSVVADGPLEGRTLGELVTELGEHLLGRNCASRRFPLLVKFIDASHRLSVQVHPKDEDAARMGLGPWGKTEAWVILEAPAGSVVYAGLKPGTDRAQLAQALADGTVAEHLHPVPVQPGDCVLVPAGTVHAIGDGILLAEVQQASTATFRLFDWNRLDKTGKPRPLHVDKAMAVIDFDRGPIHVATPDPEASPGWSYVERLAQCDSFLLCRRRASQAASLGGGDRFHVLVVLEGDAVIGHHGNRIPLHRGQVMLLPAQVETVICPVDAQVTLLDCTLP